MLQLQPNRLLSTRTGRDIAVNISQNFQRKVMETAVCLCFGKVHSRLKMPEYFRANLSYKVGARQSIHV
ncbi:hypothetical protein RRG08_001011 [Elysia crispata]|uniref:Uncharacterized protein n=1 Tax=Elysia crispata TaxID=231223 RepID=A0AAE1AW36_9GAST|nr:hypothetical protein RRG08_001011 [Elysia crispata]